MGGLLKKSQESRAGVVLVAGARIGQRFTGDELASDAVLVGFPVFRDAGPLKCGETTLGSAHAGNVRISKARMTARVHMKCKGGL